MRWRDGFIAVDWGTTNRRAYTVDRDGALIDALEDDQGVLSVPAGGFAAAVAELRARLGDRPMLLAGMIGSNRGWIQAPYVPCPVALDALAGAVQWVEPGRTAVVPGVSILGETRADVMRGEEVQLFGAVEGGLVPRNALVCHPGTHAKWAALEDGRIASFRTMMTGELFALLRHHSILADQLRAPVALDDDFAQGVSRALAAGDLIAALFEVRARFLLGRDGGAGGASYASGLLIGSDVRAGLELAKGADIALIGRPELCALYAAALGQAGHQASSIDGAQAFVAGARALAEMI